MPHMSINYACTEYTFVYWSASIAPPHIHIHCNSYILDILTTSKWSSHNDIKPLIDDNKIQKKVNIKII